MLTVLDVVQRSAAFLESKGVENGRLNAEWLIGSALGLDRMKLYMQFDRPLAEKELTEMRSLVGRRAKREPLQYILGNAPFHEITLKVDHRALIPRPETEQLVELILGSVEPHDQAIRVLDLGTGSGAIALALAFALPLAEFVAVDQSEEALSLARENAFFCGLQNRVSFLQSDWFEAIESGEKFDIIVSNPPYLTEAEFLSSEPEVQDHEPKKALFASEEGLADLKRIVREALPRLRPGGELWLETGVTHRAELVNLCSSTGYVSAEGIDDWSGRERFVRAIGP